MAIVGLFKFRGLNELTANASKAVNAVADWMAECGEDFQMFTVDNSLTTEQADALERAAKARGLSVQWCSRDWGWLIILRRDPRMKFLEAPSAEAAEFAAKLVGVALEMQRDGYKVSTSVERGDKVLLFAE